MTNNNNLNSQAIILLTAYFNKGDKPLTITEYDKFAQWLMENKCTPADLLQKDFRKIIEGYHDKRVTQERLETLLGRGNAMAIAMQKWQNVGIWVITRADADYPKKLKKMLGHKSPPVLYGAGEKKILRTRGVAIVGSRNVSQEDESFTLALGKKLAYGGYSIVSGGARGVDEASMMGSINAGGTTIGVVSDSLMQKVLSRKYRDAIMQGNLTLISPYHPEARFSVGNAMGRNKYIYVLADTSIVIHSGLKGGTWEGAKENLKNGWVPLFVKESLDPETGNQKLIELGGKPLNSSILELESFDFLFDVRQNGVQKTVETLIPEQEVSEKNSNKEPFLLEEKILELLGKNRLTIKAISEIISEDEKNVKKIVNILLKHGKIEKHRNRPLQFSKIMKLPGIG